MEELIELTFVSFDPEYSQYEEEGIARIWLDPTIVHAIVEEAEDRPAEIILKSGVSVFVAEKARTVVPVVNKLRKRSREQWWLRN